MSMRSSMADVVGANVRKLRTQARASLEDVASFASAYGLKWSTGMVANIEHGRAAPNLTTLLVVAAALSRLLGREIRLADLFDGMGAIAISDEAVTTTYAVQAVLSGGPVEPAMLVLESQIPRLRPLSERTPLVFRESDARMCRNIGVSSEQGAAAMMQLWNHSFSTERDRRAGPDANAQARGRISRQLKADLLGAIEGKASQ